MMKLVALCLPLLLHSRDVAGAEKMMRMTKKGGKKGRPPMGDGKRCYDEDYQCPDFDREYYPSHPFGGHFVIANRAGGSISIVNPVTLETALEYRLPDDGEPMYFGLGQQKSEIWVTDRANDRLLILKMDGCDLSVDGMVPLRAGAFHSMITQRPVSIPYPIVATTCDVDNVIVLYDVTTRRELAVLERPSIAAEASAKPHDVTVTSDYVFVTFLSPENGPGFVASYQAAAPYDLVAAIATAADPHVAARDGTNLFVAAQGGEVLMASVPELEILARETSLPSPHGMFLTFDLKHLYVTNIAEGGEDAIKVFDVATGALRADCPPVATTYPVPHNPTTDLEGMKIITTHSGGSSVVNSVFDIDKHTGCPVPDSEMIVETDLNPFGLFVLPPAENLAVCSKSS